MTPRPLPGSSLPAEIIGLLTGRGQTLAVAESLTGGLVAAALTAVPGASAALRGGVVAYATDLKHSLLGVPADLLSQHGAVHPAVAAAMAAGARRAMTADVGAATTGVAGPDPADGQPVGTVHIAVSAGSAVTARALRLSGDRAAIRQATVQEVLGLLVSVLRGTEHTITVLLARTRGRALSRTIREGGYGGVVRCSASGRECDDGPASSLAR